MNKLLPATLAVAFATSAFADIQDPPSKNYGPTRKLGRGISNLLFGIAELPVTIARINEREGNSAAAGYGVVRGVGRSCMRIHAGVFEILSFPFPTNHGTYRPMLRPQFPYTRSGYEEFPPELGNESKYPYVRKY
jgi:putative exosortase-associated protein (TIGR04073 family)